jgi:DNA-binding transcriptional MerR regulator
MTKKIEIEQPADLPRFMRAEAARRSGYSGTMLLELEERGVVKPLRLTNGTRLYTAAQCEFLKERRMRIKARQVADVG